MNDRIGIKSSNHDTTAIMAHCQSAWQAAVNQSMMLLSLHVDGLVQDCSNSSALAMELLQSCSKPSMWCVIDLTMPLLSIKCPDWP